MPDVPMVAIDMFPLVHAPPDGDVDSVVVNPEHIVLVPDIADGSVFTVTTVVI
jgi:hypothetical protein